MGGDDHDEDDGEAPGMEPGLLLAAYAGGIFPMGLEDGRIGWFAPDPRGVLPLDEFHIPHGLRRVLRRHEFTITSDRDFGAVIKACADRASTWIDETIQESYRALHELGFAHSVEVWDADGALVGGLYGVSLGAAFFGESMFSRRTDASKIALVHLVERLRAGGYRLLDVQWSTPHLERFGVIGIPRGEYERRLADALDEPGDWGAWDLERGVAGGAGCH